MRSKRTSRLILAGQLAVIGLGVAWVVVIPEPWDIYGFVLMNLAMLWAMVDTVRMAKRREHEAAVDARVQGRVAFLRAMTEAQERGMSFGDFLQAEVERDVAWAKERGVNLHGEVIAVERPE